MTVRHLDDETLSAHLDGALAAAAGAAVEAHLAECAGCGRRLAMLTATVRAVAGLPELAPPRRLDLSFLAASAAEEPRAGGAASRADNVVPLRRLPAWAVPLTAAAAALLIGLPLLGGVPRGGGAPSTAGAPALRHIAGTPGLSLFYNGLTTAQAAPLNAGSGLAQGTGSGGPAADGIAASPTAGPAALGAPAPSTTQGLPTEAGAPRAYDAASASRTFAADGLTLSMSVDPASAGVGAEVKVSGSVSASRKVPVRALSLFAVSADGQRTLLGQAALPQGSLDAGEGATFDVRWLAGSTAEGNGAGSYTLEFDVDLPASASTPAHADTDARRCTVTPG
ncbi:MAG TPA: zf-HC2 domain-containing protein [Candidatus Dormibacteraeota bacterium]|jgi:anti-sigma factor RsiW|nr:zf-HC2 domain-containing protein [Candidatus Dormibacteraeota bacterium]